MIAGKAGVCHAAGSGSCRNDAGQMNFFGAAAVAALQPQGR